MNEKLANVGKSKEKTTMEIQNKLSQNLIECEDYLKQLNNLKLSYKERLNNISFKVVDDW
jgi:hypothetical protein